MSKAREEMISPAVQRTAIEDWAARSGRVIVTWLEDLDESGRDFAKRKVLDAIGRLERDEADEIAVYRYDRFGRNAAQSLANIRRAELAGGRVVSVTEPFDADTAVGKYGRTNALALAEMQSDIIGENWRATQRHRYDRGLPASGKPRFGYTYDKATGYTPDPETGLLVVECYRRYLNGEGMDAIATALRATGQLTTRGGPWSQQTIRRYLDSGFPAGLLQVGVRRGKPELRAGSHEPLIDKATWEAYVSHRGEVAGRYPRLRKATYRLSGLLRCGHCTAAVGHKNDGHTREAGVWLYCTAHQKYGKCVPLHTRRDAAEQAVEEWLGTLLADRGQRYEAQLAAKAARTRIKANAAALARERAGLDQELGRLTRQHVRGVIPEGPYMELRDEINARCAEIDAVLADAERKQRSLTPAVSSQARSALADWRQRPPEQANESLRLLVREVRVFRGQPAKVVALWDS